MRPIRFCSGNAYLEIEQVQLAITDFHEAPGLMNQLRISSGEHDYPIEIKSGEVHFWHDLAFEMLG